MSEKSFATAAPAENMVLAFFLMVLFVCAAGFVPDPAQVFVLIPLGFSCSLVQLICGIISLKNHDVAGGNVDLAFSVFTWHAFLENLLKVKDIIPADTNMADGILYLMMGIIMLGFTRANMRGSTATAIFIVGADIFFIGSALGMILGNGTICSVANYGLLLCVFSCLWQAIGVTLNTLYGKEVCKLGPPWVK